MSKEESQTASDEMDLPIDWLISKGFPSFDEFKKNPDKWRTHHEELLASVDQSTITFKDSLSRQVYYWRDQYKCKSLADLQRVARNEGYEASDLEMEPKARPMDGSSHGGRMEIVIYFWPRAEFAMRGGIVPNA